MSTATEIDPRVLQMRERLMEPALKRAEKDAQSLPPSLKSTPKMALTRDMAQEVADSAAARAQLADVKKLEVAVSKVRAKREAEEQALHRFDEKRAAERLPLVAAYERAYVDDITADNQWTRRRRDVHRAVMPAYQVDAIQRMLLELWDKWRAEANTESDWVVRAGTTAAMQKLNQPTGGSIANMLV